MRFEKMGNYIVISEDDSDKVGIAQDCVLGPLQYLLCVCVQFEVSRS